MFFSSNCKVARLSPSSRKFISPPLSISSSGSSVSNRRVFCQHFVDGLLMLLENQAVLLVIHFLLQAGEVGQQIAGVLVLGCGCDVGSDSGNFGEQAVLLLFGAIGGHISFLRGASSLLLQVFLLFFH